MGKRGRPAGKKASQAPKVATSQPSKYGIARFLVRSTSAAKPEGDARASPATAVPRQASQPKQDQDGGPPAQRVGACEEAAGRYGDARPANPSPRPPVDPVRHLEPPVLSLPVLEQDAPMVTPPLLPDKEERSAQPAKRPRISGGLGFLLSQNDRDEVVWHSSPLPVRPALPAPEDGPEPRDGSGYARGGPAGVSGRSSPVSAVKSMLSTASMLKQCGKTTSPPDSKPMSSILEQWLHARASPPASLPPGVLTPRDANRQDALILAPGYNVAAVAPVGSVSERALVLVDGAPSAAMPRGSHDPGEDCTMKTPPTGRLPLGIQLAAEQLCEGAITDAAEGIATPCFPAPGQPGKKVLLELLDRVESAVRQRRQSGSPQGALHGRSPPIPRSGPSSAQPGDREPWLAMQKMAFSLEAISKRTHGEGDSPSGLGCQEKGLAAVQGQGRDQGRGGPGGDAGPLALGVSAAELAALQAAFGLDAGDWQDEALLQEVRAACLAAEGHGPQPRLPQTRQRQLPTGMTREKDEGGQSWAGDTVEERAAAEDRGAGEAAGARPALEGGAAAKGWEGQPRGEGEATEAGGVDRALLQHQFVVTEVADCAGGESGLEGVPHKVLRVVGDLRGDEARLLLQDEWADTPVAAGDRVSVIGEWALDPASRDRQCVLSRGAGLLVHHPDVLVKGSKVGSASACLRRVVLEERLHGDDMSEAALLGTLLHMLFQAALLSGDVSSESLEEEAWLVVQQAQEKLYAAGESEQSALEHLCASIPAIQQWAHDFLRPTHAGGPEAVVDFGVEGQLAAAVTQVVDIEESVWSPLYGLKGKIDASLRVTTRGRGAPRTSVMPFELKTGKSTTGYALLDHRAQVIMYTLLMGDRYQEAIPGGLLFQSHTGRSLGIPVQRSELVSLLQRRNQLAHALAAAARSHPGGPALPPVLQEDRQCQRCSQLEACAVYQAATQGALPAQGGPLDCSENEAVAGKGSHLGAGAAAFFRHWEYLLSKEEEETQGDLRGVWGQSGRQRQAAGHCLAALRLAGEPQPVVGGATPAGGRAHTLVYHFRPDGYAPQDGPLHEGDYVLLSTEGDHAAVAITTGIIVSKDPDGIKVSVPAALRLPAWGGLSGPERLASTTWRLDRNETAYHTNLARSNLVALLAASGDDRRRALIVDQQAPVFDCSLLSSQDPALAYCRQLHHINDDQRAALTQVLCARDYCMVLGMPGTGKTTTICHAVRALLARGASVLVTSHTNSAVDNILTKLHQQGVEFVRVGRLASIHPAVQQAALDNPGTAPASVAALEARVAAARVVGVTCLGVTHPLFRKRTFDVCIVDEASQITLPAVLGPLLCARTFVLVGDHHQLPPLVKSAAAREGGLDVSLFKLLSDAHPQAVAALQTQYRMCADIMLLSNTLVYDHRLRCASPALACARLALASDFAGSQDSAWLRAAVDPLRRVVFLDTDSLGGGQEARQQGVVHNMAEACLVAKVVSALEAGGVSPADIGVISPYQAQVKLIARLTPALRAAGLEVHTVDKYQGRDKECILVSFVRSNREKAAGVLLQDARRINVALTRAKKKLVLVGSGSTLGAVPLLAALLRLVLDQRWLVCLPPGVLQHQPLHVPRDDAAALRLAAHVQQSLSQREVGGTSQPDAAQNGPESSEGGEGGTPARPARYSPKGKVWQVFQRGAKSKDKAEARRPLKQLSDNVVANRRLA